MQMPAVEQDLELFEKPPPIEPAATISSMGEVAAAVQPDVDLAPPSEPVLEPQPATEQLIATESSVESAAPATVEPNQPETPAQDLDSRDPATQPEPEPSSP